MRKKSIKDVHKLGKLRNFSCLSTEYVNSKEPLIWKCNKCGHEWLQNYNNIRNGSGCPKCAGRIKLTIEDMQIAAAQRGGKFLSTEYINSYTRHLWGCGNGHRWEATPSQIIHQNQWCGKCAGNVPRRYDELVGIVNSRAGELLTSKDQYMSGKSKVKIKCNCGYLWTPIAASVFSGKWCPKCGNSIKKAFKDIQDEAKRRGGTCLSSSKEYKNNKSKLKFQCICGNIFENSWNNIQQGRWCPYCSTSREERTCRAIFEQFFKKPFVSYWPEWLRNQEGKKLQLDGYNKDLKIAFEYQGRQHYQFSKKFYKNIDEFEKRKRDDKLKKKVCDEKGIRLFEIKYVKARKIEDTHQHIISEMVRQCDEFEIKFDKNVLEKELDVYKIYQTPRDLYKLLELVELATLKKGMILNKEYKGVLFKYDWKCLVCGTEWKAKANDVKNNNTWCPKCGYKIVSQKMKKYRKGKSKQSLSADN
ncbi:MAG: zinc-ribbon domain-containing protein [Deltaproteobacteria bacterium]|uniref:Zinc-ribbon domain-containing protein n=1 Tax=Candidatus Desulfacyla euxinica TaxID=2841693 RepID=A0A8J6MYD2_9DELT|nr:zinc-ribbon domain-containing protein [Candidatus Desulfacyla euxinica]